MQKIQLLPLHQQLLLEMLWLHRVLGCVENGTFQEKPQTLGTSCQSCLSADHILHFLFYSHPHLFIAYLPYCSTNSGVGTVEPTSSCTGWYKSGEECCRRYYGERDCHLVDVTARTTEATATALSCGTWHASRETPRSW